MILIEALFRPATSPALSSSSSYLNPFLSQYLSPVLRFGPALSRVDVEEAVVRVHRVVEHAAELEVRDRLLEVLDVVADGAERGVVTFLARHGEELAGVLEPRVDPVEALHHRLERAALLAQLLGPLGVVPDLRILEGPDDFYEALLLRVVVKDTSAARSPGRRGRRGSSG
jgi:hypothetical protein